MYTEVRGGLGDRLLTYVGTNRDLCNSWGVKITDGGRFFYDIKPLEPLPSYFNSIAEVDEDNMDDESLIEYLGCYKIKEAR